MKMQPVSLQGIPVDHNSLSAGRRLARIAFLSIVVLLLLSTFIQAFVAGVFLFGVGSWGERVHSIIGSSMPLFALLLPFLGLLGRFPRAIIWRSVMLLVLVIIQVVLGFINIKIPLLFALHPANALLVFALSLSLLRWTRQLSRPVDRTEE
jgi:heme A synthase